MNIFAKINLLAWHTGQQIKRGTKRVFNLSLTDPKAWDRSLWNLYGSQSLSGEVVTEETALTYSAVFNAITLISGTIGSLPLHLMRPDGRNKKQATEQSLYRVMHTQFNPYMSAMTGRECMMAHILAWGNGYAEVVRNGLGDVVELWPITPNRVTPEMAEGKLVYRIKRTGEPDKIFPRERILHVPGLGFDGFTGYSVIAMARKSIGLGMAMETFGSRYFGNGTHPSAVVTHPNQLKDSKAMRKVLSEVYAGLGNSHQLMLLEDGMKIEKVGIPPEDSQFLESRIFQISEIARWFNLNLHKLKELDRATNNNIESEQTSYYVDCLLPWLVQLEQNYYMQLLTKSQQEKQGLYFKHIVEGLLRANSKDRAEYYRIMIGSGLMTPNEGREKEDMNSSDHPLADELFMPTGLIPLSKFEEYLAKNTGRQSETKQIPETTEEEPLDGKQNLYLLQKNKEL